MATRARALAAVALVAALTGCATVRPIAESPDTFAACQIADAATTAIALGRGGFVEANPVMRALIGHGWLPLLAFKAGLIWMVYRADAPPPVQTTLNAIACAPAIHNTRLLIVH